MKQQESRFSKLFGPRTRPAWQTFRLDLDDLTVQSSSDLALLAERIERIGHALTAEDFAQMMAVSRITIFKQAKAGRIPAFRIGTCVRFDSKAVANWLRTM